MIKRARWILLAVIMGILLLPFIPRRLFGKWNAISDKYCKLNFLLMPCYGWSLVRPATYDKASSAYPNNQWTPRHGVDLRTRTKEIKSQVLFYSIGTSEVERSIFTVFFKVSSNLSLAHENARRMSRHRKRFFITKLVYQRTQET